MAVRELKNRERVVIRFYVTPVMLGTKSLSRHFARCFTASRWYVIDAETWEIASGTKTEGYSRKAEAIKIAERYRDEFGAYVRSPF